MDLTIDFPRTWIPRSSRYRLNARPLARAVLSPEVCWGWVPPFRCCVCGFPLQSSVGVPIHLLQGLGRCIRLSMNPFVLEGC